MSVWKAGSGGVTQSKRSGLTLYYYLNAGEESSAFQSIYINFKQCFSSAIWELGEEGTQGTGPGNRDGGRDKGSNLSG